MKYVALGVVRYFNNSTNGERVTQIKIMIHGTMIADMIDNALSKDEKKVALVYGQNKVIAS